MSRVGETVAGLKLLSRFPDTRSSELYVGECDDGRCLVKLIRAELCRDRARVDRALDTARAVGALDHRGIEFVIEAGWDGDAAYVLGDIVPGTTAARLVARRSLDADSATALVELLAGALAAAHARGVVHHALEPVVVHIGFAADRVLIRDFGLAALIGDGDAEAAAARAPYRAPELWRDPATAGPAADVYALGCIAFELLAHAPPLPATTLAEAAASHADATPPRVRAVAPEAPVAVDALVARMLAKDPAARPTAAEVLAELVALSRGATNVAVAATQDALRRRGERVASPPPEVRAPVAPSRIARGPAWRCDRCGTHNARGHAFCLHCSAPAPALAALAPHDDIGAMMAALAVHGSDEVTPPPGPPPEPEAKK